MKYAALLTNDADAVAAWEQMTPGEAQAARAVEVPKWEALYGELGPSGMLGFQCRARQPDHREDRPCS